MTTTQLHIRQGGDSPLVIAVHEDEMVDVRLVTHPKSKTGERPAPTLSVTGLRWREGRHYHLGWVQKQLAVGASLSVDYVAKADPVSPLVKDQEYMNRPGFPGGSIT